MQLLQIEAQCNALVHLPEEICQLSHLRSLHIHSCTLRDLPPGLWHCSKLKDLQAHGNKFADNRLRKMTEDGKTSCSAILEYLRKQEGPKGKGKGKGKDRTRGASRGDPEEETVRKEESGKVIEVLRPSSDEVTVQVMEAALAQRPYLVCCMIRDVDLSNEQLSRSFIKFQENLHDTICERRLKACIGSHNLDDLRFPLEFTTADANEVKVRNCALVR